VVNAAKGGLLFIDEAYRLTSVESKNDFGREAVETLMAAMNDQPGKAPVMVFAGYIGDMSNFMRANEGLYRRIGYTFDFTDYTCRDLAHIFELTAAGKGFKVELPLLADDRAELADVIENNTLPRSRALMNGGLCERIFDVAKQNLDTRDDPDNPTIVISREDICIACKAIPCPPNIVEAPVGALIPSKAVADAAVSGTVATVAQMAPKGMPAPLQSQMLSALTGEERNVWFHIDTAQNLRRVGFICCGSSKGLSVSVRFDTREVHRTALRPFAKRGITWHETRIVPFRRESLIEFAVLQGSCFMGSATLALSGVEMFDGVLELRAMDQPAGELHVKVGWQLLAMTTGGDSLKTCMDNKL
jgi:hypothetical protein